MIFLVTLISSANGDFSAPGTTSNEVVPGGTIFSLKKPGSIVAFWNAAAPPVSFPDKLRKAVPAWSALKLTQKPQKKPANFVPACYLLT